MARFPRGVRRRADFARQSPTERARYEASLRVLSDMRADPSLSLRRAAEQRGMRPQTVRAYVGDALETHGRRWRVRPADRLYRPMFVYSAGQRVDIDVRGSRVASTVGAYHNAIKVYLETGDDTELRQFAGMRVGGVELEADPEVIEELGRRGAFDFASIYRLVA